MSTQIHFQDIEHIIRETLDMGKAFKISPNGASMLPLIVQGRDSVYIKKPHGRLKKYDIAFFKRRTGEFILHRVVKVKKDSYTMCGDHQYIFEDGIHDCDIIGVVSKLIINGKTVLPTDPGYRRYVFLRVNTITLRRNFAMIKNFIKSRIKRTKKTVSK